MSAKAFWMEQTPEIVFICLKDEPVKTIEEAFFYDDAPDTADLAEKQKDECFEKLHVRLRDGAGISMEELANEVSDADRQFFQVGSREDELAEKLTPEERARVRELAAEIFSARAKGSMMATAEFAREASASKDSYGILKIGEMAFQAGRAYEDVFWCEVEAGGDFLEKIKAAACSAECFDAFLEHKNRSVQGLNGRQPVYAEDIAYREGKVVFRLGELSEDNPEKCALWCRSYAIFDILLSSARYQGTTVKNEYLAMEHYYYAMTCRYLLGYAEEDLYLGLCDRGIESCGQALAMWESGDGYKAEREQIAADVEMLQATLESRKASMLRLAEETRERARVFP